MQIIPRKFARLLDFKKFERYNKLIKHCFMINHNLSKHRFFTEDKIQ